ncbi:hypothetical protein RISK_004043 [Rhodopirellula islandica]|uniref:Uncharacterized protein n=1 Tax=Rhodopirellula islandica TaxID=595434 RepID=A0A0J1BAW6_RHOIS|nr:hypothetical protein RISK_004043 [Rhodopirellula islandica]
MFGFDLPSLRSTLLPGGWIGSLAGRPAAEILLGTLSILFGGTP